MRIPKGGTPFPSIRASRRRAHNFNKTTERKKLQSKTSSFYEKRRLDFDPKVDNDSKITIHLTQVKLWKGQNFDEEKKLE